MEKEHIACSLVVIGSMLIAASLSTMHQCLIQCQGDNVEVVRADTSVSVAAADPAYWEFGDYECFSGRICEGGVIKVNDECQQLIQAIGSESLF